MDRERSVAPARPRSACGTSPLSLVLDHQPAASHAGPPVSPPGRPPSAPPLTDPPRPLSLPLIPYSRTPTHPAASADPAIASTKWWDSHPSLPNLRSIDGGLDNLLNELRDAGDALVIVDVYGSWCGACRAVFPKFTKLAEAHPDVVFLKLPFDENKAVAKALGVRALPAFIAFRGADGKLETFTAGPSKAGVLAAAIERHNSPRCQLGKATGSPELLALAAQRRAEAEAALSGATPSGAGVA